MSLARLLEQATPGPWEYEPDEGIVIDPLEGNLVSGPPLRKNARLIALAPDMAQLLIDAVAALDCRGYDHYTDFPLGRPCNSPDEPMCDRCALRARFAELEQQAAR